MLKYNDESPFQNARVEKVKKCSNVMMNRRLKCPRGKNEKTRKCDDESPFKMPVWKKRRNAQM
jgi:hypothetical protein